MASNGFGLTSSLGGSLLDPSWRRALTESLADKTQLLAAAAGTGNTSEAVAGEIALGPRALDRYFSGLMRVIKAAGLSEQFVSAPGLLSSINVMRTLSASGHFPLSIRPDSSTGLPQSTIFAATPALHETQSKSALNRSTLAQDHFDSSTLGTTVNDRTAGVQNAVEDLRTATALLNDKPEAFTGVHVKLLDYDRKMDRRTFQVSQDLVTYPPRLQRTSLIIRQEGTPRKAALQRQGAGWAIRPDLAEALSSYGNEDLPLFLLKLNDLPKAGIDSVVRSSVGPIYFEGVGAPAAVQEALESAPGNMIGLFDVETAKFGETKSLFFDPEDAERTGAATAFAGGWSFSRKRKIASTSFELSKALGNSPDLQKGFSEVAVVTG
jgi:hypothetical protein